MLIKTDHVIETILMGHVDVHDTIDDTRIAFIVK
jgi:hypothetical protein